MSNREKRDWSEFTDPESATSLLGNVVRKTNRYDSYTGKTVFKARALTDMWPLTANQLMALDGGATGNESGNNQRYAFKARIIGENSPHSFLPDVCDPAYTGDEESTYRLIAMHTTFITTNIAQATSITRGDIVTVEMEKTGQAYNLEYGRFVELSSIESPVNKAKTECFSLVNLVGDWAPNVGANNDHAGQSTPGTALHRNSKPSTDLTLDELSGITLVNELASPLGRSTSSNDPKAIVIHTTVTRTGPDAVSVLGKRGLSYHFVIDKDGTIRQLTKIEQRAQHDLHGNVDTVGIALVNLSYDEDSARPDANNWQSGPQTDGSLKKWEPFSQVQITATRNLIKALRKKYPAITKVGPHSATPGGKEKSKQDPGPLFPSDIYVG